MKLRNFIFFLMLAGFLPFALGACDSEGPAEKAGENVDQAAEKASDAAENAKDKVEDKTDEMGDKIEQKTDN